VPRGLFVVLPLAAAHFVCALGFFVVTAVLFSVPPVLDESTRGPMSALWLFSGLLLITTWSLALAPLGFWTGFVTRERTTLLLAILAGVAASAVAYQARHLWDGLAHGALVLSHAVLELRYDSVVLDPQQYRLGVGDFVVTIGHPCSGYEGIGLISVFTGLYLYVFRREFRFPRALLLFPIGIVAIWLFNVLRIAILIGLGAEVSPELALEGFHSQAGWISFLMVSSAILYLAHRSGFARTAQAQAARIPLRDSLPAATLLPLVLVVAVGLTTSALAGAIDWLYPLRALAGIAALVYCWRALQLGRPATDVTAVVMGVAVALLWILLATPDPAQDRAIAAAWQQQDPFIAWAWLLIRLAAAIVLIPIVEELVFRGYLLARLSGTSIRLHGEASARWIAVLASSGLFAVLHDTWMAGFIAGLAYALLRRHSASIWSPIVSHATTNAVLAVYVLGSQTWSLW
jgi:exosortase E/protease (VPEID-CTERM system)